MLEEPFPEENDWCLPVQKSLHDPRMCIYKILNNEYVIYYLCNLLDYMNLLNIYK